MAQEKIESLTKEQMALMPKYVEKWTNIGSCTDPADRKRAEAGAVLAYKIAGLAPPTKFFWFDSPFAAVKALKKVFGKDYYPLNNVCYGQQEAASLSFYNYFAEVCNLEICKKLEGIEEIAKSAGWFFPYRKAVVFCERPNFISLDDRKRLHNTKGPALTFPDGEALYRIHGVEVTKEDVTKPISLKRIQKEQNIEVRRVLIDLMGMEKYMKLSKAEVIDDNPRYGKLLRVKQQDDEDIVTAMVLNSTPEPDGTFKTYFLRVPPTMTNVKEAIKWTFPLVYGEVDYDPEVET